MFAGCCGNCRISLAKYKAENLQTVETTKITLNQLNTLYEYDKVLVKAKVIQVRSCHCEHWQAKAGVLPM
jgi:hypothetical protein